MATSTATAPQTIPFSFEKVLTRDFTDFYAILDTTKDEWVADVWVTVPEGANMEAVETAFSQGHIVTE